jgi:oxygen-dependent protoporphyrinogen oxidase
LEGGGEVEADGCILAIAGPSLAGLIEPMSESLAASVNALRYASLCVVNLSVPDSIKLIPNAFGVLFPGGMPLDLLGVMFNSQIFPHMAPVGRQLLTVVLGGDQIGDRSFDELDLRARLPGILEQLLGIRNASWLSTSQWRGAIPQFRVGHYEVVEAFDQFESANPGIVFVGVDRGGVGVSDRIRLAKDGVKRFRSHRVETVV